MTARTIFRTTLFTALLLAPPRRWTGMSRVGFRCAMSAKESER
jgi:hypothetical protein